MCQFESTCTTLPPEEAAQVVEELMKEIEVRERERMEGERRKDGGREEEGWRERGGRMEDGRREGGREGEGERREGREGKRSEKNDHVVDPTQSLEAPVRELTSGVEELRKGGYHDTETVQQR